MAVEVLTKGGEYYTRTFPFPAYMASCADLLHKPVCISVSLHPFVLHNSIFTPWKHCEDVRTTLTASVCCDFSEKVHWDLDLSGPSPAPWPQVLSRGGAGAWPPLDQASVADGCGSVPALILCSETCIHWRERRHASLPSP